MANRRFYAWFFPLLISVLIAGIQPAAAKPRDLSLYPLRVHIFDSQWQPNAVGGTGSGIANLFDGQDVHGIAFSYSCPINYLKSVGNQAYAAKWKKPGKTIEIVGSKLGDESKSDTCEFKITLHEFVYDVQNGTVSTFTLEQYKVRVGMTLPNAAPVDADLSHYPVRLSILDVSWAPPLNGTRSASGRGNLRLPTGASSVDFTSNCNVVFPVTGESNYYAGRWTQEGTTLALLLIAGGTPYSCLLKTSVHTDVYVRDSTGAIKAISADDYRRTVIASTAADASPSSHTPGSTEPNKKPGAGLGSAQVAALYLKACDAGTAMSCRNLALMYANGTGLPQDYARAAELYRKACNGGDSEACSNLALMLENGTGVPRDSVQAATLYRKACDAGSIDPCINLGNMYEKGVGVAQDHTQAASLFRKACDGGSAIGCSHLGVAYEKPTSATVAPK